MYLNLPNFNKTITILNKLKCNDNNTNKDIWYKFTIKNCYFSINTTRNIVGTTVSINNSYLVQIPKNNYFKPYDKWIQDIEQGFTISTGDYIILDEIFENVESSNILKIVQKYKPNSFQITSFKNNTETDIKGIFEFYKIQGV